MMLEFLVIASGLTASTYGYGEKMCGDVGKAVPCVAGELTASGVVFDPDLPQAALAAPKNVIITPTWIHIRVDNGPCVKVHLVDKMNPRWVGERGLDLTPAAVEKLTGSPAKPYWKGQVFVCNLADLLVHYKQGTNALSIYKGPYAPSNYNPIFSPIQP